MSNAREAKHLLETTDFMEWLSGFSLDQLVWLRSVVTVVIEEKEKEGEHNNV